MKLRLRSLETKQTHRIETPDPCSLHQLKQLLYNSLEIDNPSSSIENLHLSLNRRDELQSSSPNEEESLQSLDIISGDLIFFTFNPSDFSSYNPQITLEPSTILPSSSSLSSQEGKNPTLDETQNSQITLKPQGGKPISDETSNAQNTLESPLNLQSVDAQEEEMVENEEKVVDVEDYMEVDDDITDEGNVGKSFSVPGFLRKVFTEELGDRGGRDHELLVIAIHAILLESGFVGFDPVSKLKVNRIQFGSECPAGLFKLSLYYTLPEMITGATDSIDAVVLKFHSLSKYVTVYASLSNYKSVVHRVNFDENKLVPFLNVVWANCGLGDEICVSDGIFSSMSAEKQVFEFWRNVKDGLVLPLLIDLCEKAGFTPPACFTWLPTELKLKILEFLPGVDVAKVSCVSSELRYLLSSDELWKKKYVEKFGDARSTTTGGNWKQKFVNRWKFWKRKRAITGRTQIPINRAFNRPLRMPRIVGGPHDIWPHGVIGGDYDRLPQPSGGIPQGFFGPSLPFRAHRLSHVPRCNLSGSGNRTFI